MLCSFRLYMFRAKWDADNFPSQREHNSSFKTFRPQLNPQRNIRPKLSDQMRILNQTLQMKEK